MDSLKPRFPEKKAQYVYSVSSIILTRSSAEPPPRYSIIIHNFVSYKTKKEENHFQNESRKFFFLIIKGYFSVLYWSYKVLQTCTSKGSVSK